METDTKIEKGKEIQIHSERMMTANDVQELASIYLKSGMLQKGIDTKEKAFLVMQTGRDLGLTFTESLRSINVIAGRPCMSSQLMLGLCYATKEVEKAYPEESTDKRAVFVLKRKGQPEFRSIFTIEEADNAGFSKSYDGKPKDNWRKQAATMLMWRAVSKAVRLIFPDAISGLYNYEEMADDLDLKVNAETKEVEVVEVHEEKKEPVKQVESAKEENAKPEGDQIPDEELGNWVMPGGLYHDKRLIEIIGIQTEGGRLKGLEYLQKCVTEGKDKEKVNIISRFLDFCRHEGLIP